MLIKELYDSTKELKIDDYVKVKYGPHKGKPGYINRVYTENGKLHRIEVQLEDKDNVYIWLNPDQVSKIVD